MAETITVATVADLPPGARRQIEVHGTLISLWNVNGTIYAIDDTCTHEEEYLSGGEVVDDCCVECPFHGATFNLRTGAATMPATAPVRTYPVTIDGDAINISI